MISASEFAPPNPLRALPQEERPREKFLQRGEAGCGNEELLCILLQSGSRGVSALDLARRLLAKFGGLSRLAAAGPGELRDEAGLGPARAAAVAAAFALGRRLGAQGWRPEAAIRSSQQVFDRFRSRFEGLRKERFYALLLDGKNRLLREELVSEGTLNSSLVHPREVFGPAIREGAASLIVLHNHPSGDAQPSPEDREVTRRLQQASAILGVSLLDHLILGRGHYYSFSEGSKNGRSDGAV